MEKLLHNDTRWLERLSSPISSAVTVSGGISNKEEEEQLNALNDWMEEQGLPCGELAYDFADTETGEQKAIFDLVWANGIQEELSQPVAVLLNENAETISIASQAGFKCFTNIADFKKYVETDILAVNSEPN